MVILVLTASCTIYKDGDKLRIEIDEEELKKMEETEDAPSESASQSEKTDGVPKIPSEVDSFIDVGSFQGEFRYQEAHVYGIKVEESEVWVLEITPEENLDLRLKYLGPKGEDFTQSSMCRYSDAKDVCASEVSSYVDKGVKGYSETLTSGGAVSESPESTYVRYILIEAKQGKGKYTVEFRKDPGTGDIGKSFDAIDQLDLGYQLDPGTYEGYLQWHDSADCYRISPTVGKHSIKIEPDPNLDVSIFLNLNCMHVYESEVADEAKFNCNVEDINTGFKGVDEKIIWDEKDGGTISKFCVTNKDLTEKGNYKIVYK
jgi:hypothetical protein